MKKLSLFVAAGAMALLLAACGDNNAPKQPEVKTETVTEQAAQPAAANDESATTSTTTSTEGATNQE